MSENEKTKRTDARNEEWAILQFDEAEDDARWAKLSNEMDELLEKTISTEKLTGTILMKEDLNRFAAHELESVEAEEEDQLF